MGSAKTSAGALIGDRFILREQLGKGGHATVWLAHDQSSGADVALKLMHRGLRESEKALGRLEREVGVLARLTHPNIARSVHIQIDAAVPYFAMELVHGEGLDRLLARHSMNDDFLAPLVLAGLVSQMAAGLQHAHNQGVVHRDFKPANIMVASDEGEPVVKLVDFGIAKLLSAEGSAATTQGRVLGTFTYMSPEQVRGETVGPRADVYALGVVLFELVTLRRTWHRHANGGGVRAYSEAPRSNPHNSVSSLARRVIEEERPIASQFAPGFDERFDDLIVSAMAVDPNDRPESCVALAEAVEAIAQDSPKWPGPFSALLAQSGLQLGAKTSKGASGPQGGPSGTAVRGATGPKGTAVRGPGAAADSPFEVGPAGTAVRPTGPSGTAARGPTGTAVLGPTGTAVQGPTGTAVQGPTGTAVRRRTGSDGAGPTPGPFVAAPSTTADEPVLQPGLPTARSRSPAVYAAAIVAVIILGVSVTYVALRPQAPAATSVPLPPTPSLTATPGARSAVRAKAPPPKTEVAPEPTRAKREPRAGRTSRRSKPRAAAKKAKTSRLRSLLARVRADPSDTGALAALAKGIEAEAKGLENRNQREKIANLAQTSAFVGDVTGLERALRLLETAQ